MTSESDVLDDEATPLDCGAAAPPRVLGGGCLSRYDPEALNEESGADFSQAQRLVQLASESD